MAHLPLWTPLASLMLALGWLLPNTSPPWLAFHKDAWVGLVFLLVAVVLLWGRRPAPIRISFDAFALVFAALGALCLLQWVIGIVPFSGHALVGFGYFVAAGLVLVLGRGWEVREPGKPGDFLFHALWMAAMVTSGIMLVQWLRLSVSEVWVNPVPAWGRPFGNLIQPNNAGTLLLLGLVSLLWFAVQRRLRLSIALLGAVYLTFFVVLTGSRIGYLSFFVLALAGLWMGRRRPDYRAWRWVFVAALVAFPVFLYLVTRDWGTSVEVTRGTKTLSRSLTGVRFLVYHAYVEAAFSQPWLGFGFEQGAKTQLAAHALGHELPGLFTWAHNAFLDLATWFGLPAVMAAIAAVMACVFVLFRSPFDARRSVYFAAVYVLFMHGMVELPLAFAYFLLPACLLVGAMTAGLRWPSVSLPIGVARVLVVGLGTLLAAIAYDYLRVESAFYTWRFMNANIGRDHPMDIPDTLVLNQHEALLKGLRGTAEEISDADLKRFEQVIFLDPSAAGMQHLALLQLKRGDVAGAQRTADMAHVLTQGEKRRQLAARWNYLGSTDPAFRAVIWRAE